MTAGSNGCLYVYGGAHDDTQHQVACGLTKLGLKLTAAGKPFGLGIDVMTRAAMASHLGRSYNQETLQGTLGCAIVQSPMSGVSQRRDKV
jgi:hypothetical protein